MHIHARLLSYSNVPPHIISFSVYPYIMFSIRQTVFPPFFTSFIVSVSLARGWEPYVSDLAVCVCVCVCVRAHERVPVHSLTVGVSGTALMIVVAIITSDGGSVQ